MARIRTLKPEFWDSPSTAQADLAVRLTFMAMWNWADDSGHGVGNLKEIEAFAFPNDEVTELPRMTSGKSAGTCGTWRDFAEICGEVQKCYGIVFYRVKGRPYYWIPSFKAHQSRDFTPKSRYPTQEEGEIFDIATGKTGETRNNPQHNEDVFSASSAPSSGKSADASGNPALGTGEQGNRGTGEQNTCSPAAPSSERASGFDEFWSIYPRKVGKQKAKAKYQAACKRANAETILSGAYRLANDPNLPEQQFIPHPTTWLERNGWDDEPLPNKGTGNKSTDRALAGWDAMSSGPATFNPMWDTPILEEDDQ